MRLLGILGRFIGILLSTLSGSVGVIVIALDSDFSYFIPSIELFSSWSEVIGLLFLSLFAVDLSSEFGLAGEPDFIVS